MQAAPYRFQIWATNPCCYSDNLWRFQILHWKLNLLVTFLMCLVTHCKSSSPNTTYYQNKTAKTSLTILWLSKSKDPLKNASKSKISLYLRAPSLGSTHTDFNALSNYINLKGGSQIVMEFVEMFRCHAWFWFQRCVSSAVWGTGNGLSQEADVAGG